MHFDSPCSPASFALGLHYVWYVELPEISNGLPRLRSSVKICCGWTYYRHSEHLGLCRDKSRCQCYLNRAELTCLTLFYSDNSNRSVTTRSEMLFWTDVVSRLNENPGSWVLSTAAHALQEPCQVHPTHLLSIPPYLQCLLIHLGCHRNDLSPLNCSLGTLGPAPCKISLVGKAHPKQLETTQLLP